MHRPLLILALVLLYTSLPVLAQHGGGHGSAGGHGGGFASHGSFGGGGHAFSGARAGSGFGGHSYSPRSFAGQSFTGRSYPRRAFNRTFTARRYGRSGTGVRIRTYGYGFRNNCYGYPCRGYGYPWGYYAGIDPYWWWDSGSSYDQDQQNQIGLAEEMNQQSLAEQMRQQSDANSYAQSAPAPHQQEVTEPAPATVLVFHDQHKQEVKNYAIVGQTLWNFAPQRTEKIPLSELDIPATTKANEDRGVSFRLPGGQEGQ